ncbi:MAG: hypothetical protein EOO63_06095 [Hymenobacter sp.]|nr:MAG: hypothetical protein EOO63_06095 [Hymenobacter sp.]
MVTSFFVPALLAGLVLASGPPPPRCTYAQVPPTTRQLLQRIDHALPPLVTRLRLQDPDDRMPYVEVDSCFHLVVLDRLFSRAAEAGMRQGLRQLFYKEMGEHLPQEPQAASLLVLAYTSVAAATAAEHLQDSLRLDLQHRCKGRIQELEPCVELDSHRFTRLGSHLLHYTLYSQDPNRRASLRSLAAALTGELLPPAPRQPRRAPG